MHESLVLERTITKAMAAVGGATVESMADRLRDTGQKHVAAPVRISPSDARALLECNFDGQRSIDKQSLARYREEIKAGRFDGGEPIRFCRYEGRLYLVNGQHRLLALSGMITGMEFVVVVTRAESIREVAEIYSTIDRGRGRSIAEVMRSLGVHHRIGVSATKAALASAALLILESAREGKLIYGYDAQARSAQAREALLERHGDAVQGFFMAIEGASPAIMKRLSRRQVMAVGFATFETPASSDKALEFWSGVAQDDGLRKTDPRKMLLRFLEDNPARGTAPIFGRLGHGVAVCWNAWVDGRELQIVKVYDETSPVKLKLTSMRG